MLKFNKILIAMFIITLMMFVLVTGCGQNSAPKTEDNQQQSEEQANEANVSYELKWGTAAAGGAWPIVGNAMLEDIKLENPGITGSCLPGSSTNNIMGLKEGQYNIAFISSDVTLDAWEGTGDFEKTGKIQNVRLLGTNMPFTTHIVVRANSDIKDIGDLKGKRVSPGAKGASNDTQLPRLLSLYGLSYDDMKIQYLSFTDAGQALIDGHLDCLAFPTVPPPFAAVINAASQRDVRLLSLPEDKIAELCEYPGVYPYTMPGGIYEGVDYDVEGVCTITNIAVREDMPDEVVYKITKTLTENNERYKSISAAWKNVELEDLVKDLGIPYHPGAIKYYKEKGLM